MTEGQKDSGQAGMTRKEKKTDFTNESQQNLMWIVEFLAADITRPVTVPDIVAAREGLTYSKVTWALQNLKINAWAEQTGDTWQLSPRIVRIADSARSGMTQAMKRYFG